MTDTLQSTAPSTLNVIIHRTILIYQWAVYASFAFLGAGFLVTIFADVRVDTEMGGPSEIWWNLVDLKAEGFFGLGIGIMILAPIVMLATAAVTFLRSGDRRYAGITATVTLILSLSILVAFVNG